jgi:hypothetical protein
MANEMGGSALYLAFGGTAMHSDFRSYEHNEEVDLIDKSAGADDVKTYLVSLKDGTAAYGGLYLGTVSVLEDMVLGTEGTLEWAEKGTAAGNPRHYVNAILKSKSVTQPYNGVVEDAAGWQFSGTLTNGTY